MSLTTWEQRVIKRSQKTKGRVLLRFACWFLWVLSLWTLVQSARAFVEFAQLVRSNELQWLRPFLTESSRVIEDSALVARVAWQSSCSWWE